MIRDQATPPADWYVDPLGKAQKRYWTGTNWSDWIFDGGEPFLDTHDTVAPTASSDTVEESDTVVSADTALTHVDRAVRFAPSPPTTDESNRASGSDAATATPRRGTATSADVKSWPASLRPLNRLNRRRHQVVLLALALALAALAGAATQVVFGSESSDGASATAFTATPSITSTPPPSALVPSA